jgi:hypothetical protein
MCEKCKFILFIDSSSQLSSDRKGRTVCSVRLGRLDIGIVGSNPSQSMDACPRLCVVLSCLGTGLATGRPTVKGSLPNVDEQGSENPRRDGLCSPGAVQPQGKK